MGGVRVPAHHKSFYNMTKQETKMVRDSIRMAQLKTISDIIQGHLATVMKYLKKYSTKESYSKYQPMVAELAQQTEYLLDEIGKVMALDNKE